MAASPAAVAGYAMIGFRRGSRMGRLFTLAVLPGYARQGIGAALLAACEAAAWRRGCDRVALEARTDNTGAIALYERAGYQRGETYDDFYEDGAPAFSFLKARSG